MSSTETVNLETQNQIALKKIQKTETDAYVKATTYIINTLKHIALFFIYLYLFGAVSLYNCKVAQSGMLSKLRSIDGKSYCSPFINDDQNIIAKLSSDEELLHAPFNAATNIGLPENNTNYIATDQLSFLDSMYNYEVWGKIITFDYAENVIQKLGSFPLGKLLGYGVQNDIRMLYDNKGNKTYTGIVSSFYSIQRYITYINIYILQSIFGFINGVLPEAVIFILPAFIPLFYMSFVYFIISIILTINIIICVVLILYETVQLINFIINFIIQIATVSILNFIICCMLSAYLAIPGWFVIILSIIAYIICAFIYGCFMYFVSIVGMFILFIYTTFIFKAKTHRIIYKNHSNIKDTVIKEFNEAGIDNITSGVKSLSDHISTGDYKLQLIDEDYSIHKLFVNNIYYKMNWIVLTVTIILLINIATVYSVSGINIILIIICFIFVLTVTSRNERMLNISDAKFFGAHKYMMDTLIENNMIPIISRFTQSYSDTFSCDNDSLNSDGTRNKDFVPSHVGIHEKVVSIL
jgi:hypothetical protein